MMRVGSAADGEPTRNGQYSVRFDLRRSDPSYHGGTRTELSTDPPDFRNSERWYGLSTYLEAWAPDQAPESIFQWHQGGAVPCSSGCSPPLVVFNQKTQSGQFEQLIQQAWRESATSETYAYDYTLIGECRVDRWVDWVVHVKWSTGADGVLQIWRDGDLIINKIGRNDDYPAPGEPGVGNYFKMGIYKWPWSQGRPSDTDHRTMFVDELRIADEQGSYDAVKPRGVVAGGGNVLQPVQDREPETWYLHDANSITEALTGPERVPEYVPAGQYIWASDIGRVAEVAFADPGRALDGGTAWFFANTGADTNLIVQLVVRGETAAETIVEAGQPFDWHSLPLPSLTSQDAESLALRFISSSGADSNVRAAYLEIA
jgi:hypothetical protein